MTYKNLSARVEDSLALIGVRTAAATSVRSRNCGHRPDEPSCALRAHLPVCFFGVKEISAVQPAQFDQRLTSQKQHCSDHELRAVPQTCGAERLKPGLHRR